MMPINRFMKSDNMVKIYVGEGDENCWVLHEDVLCGRSDFFKMGFKGGFKEAHEKVMRLPEDDPVMFGYFVEWIYGQDLKCPQNPGPITSHGGKHLEVWIRLYLFGDKICLEELKTAAFARLQECSYRLSPAKKYVELVYDMTSEGLFLHPLRAWAIEKVVEVCLLQPAADLNSLRYLTDALACNAQFRRDVLEEVSNHGKEHITSCKYHSCRKHKIAPIGYHN